MRIIEDLHIHTHISKDSVQKPDAYIVEAIERGIKYLGFTDHLDLDPLDKDFGYYNYENALKDISRLRSLYDDKINLLFGVEVTYQSGLEKSILQSTQGKMYDFLMGSVHRLEGYTIAGVSGLPFFDRKSEEVAYNMYFDEMEKLVDMNYFQVIGHFDVIKRYGVKFFGPFDASKYKVRIKEILGKVVKSSAVLEINSSGFRQFPGEPYPSKDILQYYVEAGGREITIGSDAHSIKQFGDKLEKAVEYAIDVFDFEVVAFRSRKKFSVGKLSAFLENNYSKMR
jgi:histidinol-phosphatase (PHP family)